MSVQRVDRGQLKKPTKLANGWLKVDGYLTRTGVFTYRTGDGKVRRELRLAEDVFNADSLSSFGMVPITDDHPPEFLDSKNAYAFARGAVSERVVQDGKFVQASLMVTDAVLLAKVEKGEARELSCGYTCDLEDASGVTAEGEKYDCIQRNIRGNHVAIVPIGRAGPEARVRMDASSATMVSTEAEGGTSNQPNTPASSEVTVAFKSRIDGVEYEVPTEQVVQAIAKEQKAHADALEKKDAELKTAKADLEKLQAKVDGQADELKKKDAELKAAPEKLRAEMGARMALESSVRKVLGEKFKVDGVPAKDLKLAVLEKTTPGIKLDGKSDEYIQARFDMALETFEEDGHEDAVDRLRVATNPPADGHTDAEVIDSDKAAEAMKKRNRDAWKSKPSPEAA